MGSLINHKKEINKPKESPFIHPVVLKGCTLPGNIFLAPMAGFTDAGFRLVCLDMGAFFTYTEMVSAIACVMKSEKTFKLLKRANRETILGVQVFGSQPLQIAQAVREIHNFNPSLIDLNCGCSIPKILKTGSGAALLKNPQKIGEILKVMNQETDVPITLKIRSGWDTANLNYTEIGAIAEESGASLITLHPRTRTTLFSGHANWDHIKKLKENLAIPVIGSGDLFTPGDVLHMLKLTGCDGVMIARGAIGNPFIFSQVLDLCTRGSYEKTILPEKRLLCALDHLENCILLKGEKRACLEMRKHFCAYTKGLPNSALLRKQCVRANSKSDYKNIVYKYLLYEKT